MTTPMCVVELLADDLKLLRLKSCHPKPAPFLRRPDHRGLHQLDHRPLTKSVRNCLCAPPVFFKQALEQIRGANRQSVREGKTQMCNTSVKVILEASDE